MNLFKKQFMSVLFLLPFTFSLFPLPCLHAEDVKISTYYPSPFGNYRLIQIQEANDVEAIFTGGVSRAGINIIADYTANLYTPGVFWSTTAPNNAGIPKAGVWIQETDLGSLLNFGTSNNYGTGINAISSRMVLDRNGNLGIGTNAPLTIAGVAAPLTQPVSTPLDIERTLDNRIDLRIVNSSNTANAGARVLVGSAQTVSPVSIAIDAFPDAFNPNYIGADAPGNTAIVTLANFNNYSNPLTDLGKANLLIGSRGAIQHISFYTGSTLLNAASERMRITSDGALEFPTLSTAPQNSAAGKGRIYFNGTKFRISENGSAYTDMVKTVGSAGSPKFITPVVIFSGQGPSTTWTKIRASTFNSVLTGVPSNATAVILEAKGLINGPDSGDSTLDVWIRAFGSANKYLLLETASAGKEDGVAAGGQGTFPIDSNGDFEYFIDPPGWKVPAASAKGEIHLIGYYS